jgi:hypothetical protein
MNICGYSNIGANTVPKHLSRMKGQSTEIKHMRLLYVKVMFKVSVISLIPIKKYFLPKISTNIHRPVNNPVVSSLQNTTYKLVRSSVYEKYLGTIHNSMVNNKNTS